MLDLPFKTRHFTLRFSILSIFVSLFVIAMLTLIGITYVRFAHSMAYVSFKLMDEASTAIYESVMNELQDVKIETELSAQQIHSGILLTDKLASFVQYTNNVMHTEAQTLPSVQAAFWGDEKGSFVISEKQEDGSISTETIDRSHTPISGSVITRDLQGKVVSEKKGTDFIYDPRLRPWYTEAKFAKKTITTDVYRYAFQNVNSLGITIATPVFKSTGEMLGVFGFDIRLDYLRQFIEKMSVTKNGVIFIVTDEGKVVAYPKLIQFDKSSLKNVWDLPLSWVVKSFGQYKKHHQKEFVFHHHYQKYLATYLPMPTFGGHVWYIAVVIPEQDFVGELKKTNFITLFLSFFILVAGIALVSHLITRVVKPIKTLVKETEKIKNFELEGDLNIPSRIKEVVMLTNALRSMKNGLRSFQKYVPATLVRQILDAGEDAHVGGAKKEIAILFTDIQNFTTIAEQMDPKLLMSHLCEYFDELSSIIGKERGTIDKYIGDSIMAFWGAPLPEAEPCFHAARAALRCEKRLTELNALWQKQGLPPFITRIGIHLGEAIIGNLGSSERLNYTAVGDVINIASRLEGTNKLYGTMIIVSDAVYHALKNQFVLRMVDCVAMKGKSEAHFVYELLGETIDQVPFDVNAYRETFAQGFEAYRNQQWDDAIARFSQCISIHPQDTVAPLFVGRCVYFKTNPPSKNWAGVWQIEGK